ncbi:ferritin-like domain-containing protein [soil metagenome]
MSLESLKDLYVEQLRDLYSAETQILEALPKMEKAATNKELQNAFKEHRKATETHLERLEKIFKELDKKSAGHHCKGMEGLLKEGNEMVKEKGDDSTRDAGLIASAQRVEHYEIAGYGTVRSYAEQMGFAEQEKLLKQTLDEESQTDERLTKLAESVINVEAQN